MRKYLVGVTILILGFLVCFPPDISLAQEEEMEYSWGTVNSVSSGQIVVAEYDRSRDEDVYVTYTIDPKAKLENVNSLKDIAVGDSVDIEYVVREGKKVAKLITVEKVSVEEEYLPRGEYYPEEEE
ncbi:MAG: hypothetical protein JSW18_04735 [Candidatus Omnitrophota bacterium]|nr:MAG: hypothetical protein JSW18_04735 [Candidatus Omnitrophota bacterium]